MSKSNLPWLHDAFPDADAPYTLAEILFYIRAYHSPLMSKSAVNRAWKALLASRATAELARALNQDGGEKTYLFSAETARRIAKRATRAKARVS